MDDARGSLVCGGGSLASSFSIGRNKLK